MTLPQFHRLGKTEELIFLLLAEFSRKDILKPKPVNHTIFFRNLFPIPSKEDPTQYGKAPESRRDWSPALKKKMSKWAFAAHMNSLRKRGFVKFTRERIYPEAWYRTAKPQILPGYTGKPFEPKYATGYWGYDLPPRVIEIEPLPARPKPIRRWWKKKGASDIEIMMVPGVKWRYENLMYTPTLKGMRYAEVVWRLPPEQR